MLLWLTAGVFDGHGFNGRSAATYARKNIIRWLSVDTNATSKDPKKRLKALEKVCSQISRGLARSELCGFDASASGLTTCFAIVQANKICLASAGKRLLCLCYHSNICCCCLWLDVSRCLHHVVQCQLPKDVVTSISVSITTNLLFPLSQQLNPHRPSHQHDCTSLDSARIAAVSTVIVNWSVLVRLV